MAIPRIPSMHLASEHFFNNMPHVYFHGISRKGILALEVPKNRPLCWDSSSGCIQSDCYEDLFDLGKVRLALVWARRGS